MIVAVRIYRGWNKTLLCHGPQFKVFKLSIKKTSIKTLKSLDAYGTAKELPGNSQEIMFKGHCAVLNSHETLISSFLRNLIKAVSVQRPAP